MFSFCWLCFWTSQLWKRVFWGNRRKFIHFLLDAQLYFFGTRCKKVSEKFDADVSWINCLILIFAHLRKSKIIGANLCYPQLTLQPKISWTCMLPNKLSKIFRARKNLNACSLFDAEKFYKILSCNNKNSINFIRNLQNLAAAVGNLFHMILSESKKIFMHSSNQYVQSKICDGDF